MRGHGIDNRIKLPVIVLLLAALAFFGLRGLAVQSLALEQEVRCGIPAHTHSSACYDGNRRTCYLEEHQHNNNCYLILLEENNINTLLVQMAATADNSLESVIGQTVDNALTYNANLTSPLAEGTTLEDVAALNRTVEENNVQPAVVFNENIQTLSASGSSDLLGAALPTASTGTQPYANNGGATTLALGDEVSDESGWANYYIMLDNQWTLVGTDDFEVYSYKSGSKTRYRPRENLSTVLGFYNEALGTSFTAQDVSFKYATSETASSWSTAAEDSWNNYLYFQNSTTTYYSSQVDANMAKYVHLYDNSGSTLSYYTVTLRHADGDTVQQYIKSGSSITLPGTNADVWSDGSREYRGGASVKIDGPKTFTSDTYVEVRTLTLQYTVSFPNVSNVTVATKPSLQGMNVSSTTESVTEDGYAIVKGVSATEVKGTITTSTSTGQHRVIRFMGWRVNNSDVILSANTRLDWSALAAYAGNEDTITLTGVWESDALQTASFFVRYDSVAVDTNGNIGGQDSSKYTKELYAAFVMGVDTSKSTSALTTAHGVADVSADNSFTADQTIRALYGQKSEGVWLTDFPSDDYIFEQLKKDTTGNLRVDGDVVRSEDLNANVYTIRWFVFKSQSDAWHIDGRLVKKEGLLDITKTFAGNSAAIAAAKQDFYITATHVASGTEHRLYLTDEGDRHGPYSTEDGVYRWRIEGTRYGDAWTVTEHTGNPGNVIVHSDWRIVDTYGSQSANGTITEESPAISFYSTTVATDMDKWYPLTVNLTNIYHNTDSIIIKKEDLRTGNPLGGAVFQLWQNGVVMRFTYDSDTNSYLYDPTASPESSVTQLSVSQNGYYELNISQFRYADGSIVVKEVTAPDGYTPIGDIEIGYRPTESQDEPQDEPAAQSGGTEAAMYAVRPDGTNDATGGDTGPPENPDTTTDTTTDPDVITVPDGTDTAGGDEGDGNDAGEGEGEGDDAGEGEGEGEGDEGATFAVMRAAMPAATVEEDEREVEMLSNSPMAEYRNGLLIIRNSTDTTSVTVKKEWKCVSENWRPVTMQLMANGVPVTSLLSNVELTQVLDANNNWSATWGNLPLMANGAEIVWSVREIKIGDEACLSDYSFVNWLVSYSGATETYSDGRLVNTSFTVTNDTYRTLLYVVKTDLGGSIRLAGARFTLARMRNGAVDNSFTVREDVTDANGMITFDNLEHGDYCLTEVASPTGYDTMTAPIYLTIRSDGIVVVQAHDYAISGGTYTVQVLNEPLRPLPETGGSGPGWYYLLGALCMAAAAAAWCIRRREGGVSPP